VPKVSAKIPRLGPARRSVGPFDLDSADSFGEDRLEQLVTSVRSRDQDAVALPGGSTPVVSHPAVSAVGALIDIYGEFDPGSGRTLAACLTHASRTERPACGYSSGERVSNTWATCPQLWDNSGKPGLILDINFWPHGWWLKVFRLGMGPRPISLLVG
jgi:hypothetical protein